ncbi:MAG: hypothetical protein ACK4VI_01170 [Alphaproteobacteria bacterium]
MNEWKIEFETHSRDDVMKVCALLARGIGKETVASRRVKIAIDGQISAGKTAIVDGLSSAFADYLTPYKMPVQSLIEDFPCHAYDGVKKEFEIDEKNCLISLGRHEYVFINGAFNEAMTGVYDSAYDRGVDFFTGRPKTLEGSHILIDLNFSDGPDDIQGWLRKWSVTIMESYLQTEQMAEVLEHLRSFHERRQARLTQPTPPEL